MTTADGRAFDHVVIIMFENEYRGYVHRNPYMRSLAGQGIDMATSFGVMHPSNPNYTASMAGSICNVTRDPTYYALMPGSLPVNPPPLLDQTPIVDRLREHGLDWRGYMETYTPPDYPPTTELIMMLEDSAVLTVSVAPQAGTPTTATSTRPRGGDLPRDVSISLSAPSTVAAGQDLSLTVTVVNLHGFAFNVVVDVATPSPLTLVSIDGQPVQAFPPAPSLYPGQRVTYQAVYSTPATFTGAVTFTGTVSAVNQPETAERTILDSPPYMNAHNPFVQFRSVRENRDQWERIGTVYDFLRDVIDGTLPEYSWITPNMWSNGHWITGTYDEADERGDILVDQLARWLKTFFDVLRFPGPESRLPGRTLVVVTFDEADYDVSWETLEAYAGTYDGPNQIYTVLLGDGIAPRRIDGEGFNHYSLLRTIERNFGLDTLGANDADANWFQFLWHREFDWGPVSATPVTHADFAAAAGLADVLYVVAGEAQGASLFTFSDTAWSAASAVPVPADTTAVALAACGEQLVLVCRAGRTLSALGYTSGAGWSAAQAIVEDAGDFALTAYLDYGDQTPKLMLAWRTSADNIQSRTYADGAWAGVVAVGHQTDGDLALAALGASLYLVHKAAGSNEMQVVSYNTAPFNVVTSAGDSNTTQHQGRRASSPSPISDSRRAARRRATPNRSCVRIRAWRRSRPRRWTA
jgi:phosphoesterase family protein